MVDQSTQKPASGEACLLYIDEKGIGTTNQDLRGPVSRLIPNPTLCNPLEFKVVYSLEYSAKICLTNGNDNRREGKRTTDKRRILY